MSRNYNELNIVLAPAIPKCALFLGINSSNKKVYNLENSFYIILKKLNLNLEIYNY